MAHEFVVRNGIIVANNDKVLLTTSGGSQYVALQAPSSGLISGSYTITLPYGYTTSGQTLKISENGSLNFADVLTSGVVVSGYIGNNAVVSGSISSGQIGQFHLSSGTVNSGQIGSNAVNSGNVSSGQIGTYHIASGSITAEHIASGAIITADIADGAVTSGKISSGQIIAFDIASGQVVKNIVSTNGSITVVASGDVFNLSAVAAVSKGNTLTFSTSFLFNNAISGFYDSLNSGLLTISSGGITSGMIGSGIVLLNNIGSGLTLVGSGSVVSGSIASGSITLNEFASGTAFTVLNAASGRLITSLQSGVNSAQAQTNITYDGNNFNINANTNSGNFAFNISTSSGAAVQLPTIFGVSTDGYTKTNSAIYSGQTATFNPVLLKKTAGDSAFFDYFVKNTASGFSRAGSIIVGWDETQNLLEYNEYSTTDINGQTNDLTFSASLPATGTTSGYVTLSANIAVGTWNLKIGTRVI